MLARLLHSRVPGAGAAFGRALVARWPLWQRQHYQERIFPRWFGGRVTALLCLEHKAAAFVKVHKARRAVREGDAFLKDIAILGVVGGGGVGPRHTEHITEFAEKELIIGAFGGGGALPAVNKRLDYLGCLVTHRCSRMLNRSKQITPVPSLCSSCLLVA